MTAFLGIDVGTSATKALLCDYRGTVLASAAAPHTLLQPAPGWTEQDPRAWWDAALRAVRECLASARIDPARVASLALSFQMHGSVIVGEGPDPDDPPVLRPAILWNDQRTSAECAEIERLMGGRAACVRALGNAPLTGFTLPKILWVRSNEPQLWRRARAVMLPKDYIRLRMTGIPGTDVGDASGTLLLDPRTRNWSREALTRFDLDRAMLPDIHESCARVGQLRPAPAAAMGLTPRIPVAAGSGDNQCGAAGAGVVEPGTMLATLGTSGVLYAPSPSCRIDRGDDRTPAGRAHTFCAGDGTPDHPGSWCLTGCMLSAAGSLQWARDQLWPEASFASLLEEASHAPVGCEGLIFLPYLTGERCPHPDPRARGGWIGLTARHTRAHLVRSIVEGVTFAMREILDIMDAMGVSPRVIRLGGGGSRSPFWRQLQADVYGRQVELPTTDEGPAFGAALMAGVASGAWASLAEACRATIQVGESRDPSGESASRLDLAREVYSSLYPRLRDRWEGLATLAE